MAAALPPCRHYADTRRRCCRLLMLICCHDATPAAAVVLFYYRASATLCWRGTLFHVIDVVDYAADTHAAVRCLMLPLLLRHAVDIDAMPCLFLARLIIADFDTLLHAVDTLTQHDT